MKSLKKLVLIGAVVAMSTSLFTGCSYEGKTLSDAFSKTQKITSSESKTEIGLRFTAENLSAEEQKEAGKAIPMINGSKMTINTKANQQKDGKVGKMQADVAMQLGTMPLNMGVWADVNMADGKNEFKEIIKVPAAEAQKMGGKQYVVLDNSMMDKSNNANMYLAKASEDMQNKFSKMILSSMASFDPGFKIVTETGYTYMNLPDGRKLVRTFEIKLNDKQFKDLIKYTSNNLINNKDAKGLLKDYLTTVTKLSASSEEEAKANQAGIDKAFSDFDKGLPQFTAQMNKILNAFDEVTLVGDKGIVIKYAVDGDGYVVNEKGNIDLVFDSAKLIPTVEKLSGTSTQNKLTGVYKLGIDFNTSTFNINKNVEIKFPELNSENSTKFQDLISESKIK